MKNWLLALLAGGIIVGVGAFVYAMNQKQSKVVYVLNSRLLKEYKGTEDIKKSIARKFEKNPFMIDSMKAVYSVLSKSPQNSKEVEVKKLQIQQSVERMKAEEEEVTANAEAQLWNQINTHVSTFGKENNYSMIIGASGNGNLMYADSTLDVTSKVIEYMNKKYAGK